MTTFKIEIALGNDAMQSGTDVARALREVAARVERSFDQIAGIPRIIRDVNGNTVGYWALTEAE